MKQTRSLLRALIGRRWWWVTLIVIALMIVLARLGVWQLDRLQQRRASNALLVAALAQPALDLARDPLPDDPSLLKDRQVVASGAFDLDHQISLRAQNWQGQAGVHLIAPLVLDGGPTAVLVDRGWIPDADADPQAWSRYETSGKVELSGFGALSQTLRNSAAEEAQTPQRSWYRVDIGAIERQLPYELLPIYMLQAPDAEGQQSLPYRREPEIDLSEGPHLGYAVQWFIFSLGLGVAYVLFINQSQKKSQEKPLIGERNNEPV